MLRVFARAVAKPEHRETVRALLGKLVKASRAEPGVLTYTLSETAAGEFLFYEEYADRAALAVHKASRHVAVFAGRAMPLLADEFQVWEATAVEPE